MERLRAVYETELAHPTGAHRVGAAEAAAIEANQPFVFRRTELLGGAAGVIPLFFHLQTVTPGTVDRATGALVGGGVYDLAAMVGGFLALMLAIVAARQATASPIQRGKHLAVAGLIGLLGLYQSLLGLGLLHQLGVFRAS
jgi:hypothetical protein